MRRSTVFESARTRSSRCGRCRQAALAGSVGELSSAFDAEHRHSLPRGNQIEMRAEKRGTIPIWATAAVCLGFGIASLGVCAAKDSSLATEIEHDLAQGCTAAEHIPQIRERCEKAFKRLQKDVARQYDVKSFSTLAWGMPSCVTVDSQIQPDCHNRFDANSDFHVGKASDTVALWLIPPPDAGLPRAKSTR
eukprot:1580992-Rhodomonas_salina.4